MPTPPYRQISDDIRRRILAGELQPGDLVPSENELAAQYQVADETARRALSVLGAEGLTESRRGARTRVRAFKPIVRRGTTRVAQSQWGEGRSIWQADIDRRDMTTDSVVIEVRPCPVHVADALELEPGDPVLVRDRRYLVEGEPVMLAVSYLPAELVAGSRITEVDTGPGGIYGRLKDLGHGPVWFKEQVRFRAALPEEAGALGISAGAPVALLVRFAFAAEGVPVEVNEMTLDASRYVLEWEFPA